MLPVCAPVAVGPKVTPTVHDAPPANELVQVLVAILNSALLLVTLSPEIAAVPVFRTVMVVAALVIPTATEPNPCVAGVTVMGTVPVPVKLAVCVPAPSTTVRVPVRAPVALGVKLAVMVQLAPTATEVQGAVAVKSPLADTLVTASATVPVFLRVNVPFVVLRLPTAAEPRARDAGVSVAVWACAVAVLAAKKTESTKRTKRMRVHVWETGRRRVIETS
jgi:hypothetical protein